MAVFTPLSRADAERVARAHGLPTPVEIIPVAAGSVNSNFFLVGADGTKVFFRVYEEQAEDGVAFEWALLDHLEGEGIEVAGRFRPEGHAQPGPGECRVDGKPVALFELARGEMSCQASVTPARMAAMGSFLARAHQAAASFGWRKRSRFSPLQLLDERIPTIRAAVVEQPDLGPLADRLEAGLRDAELSARGSLEAPLPSAVVHGDLFRDNVLWDGERIVAALDWESAALGDLAYDLGVVFLSWCFDDRFDPALARAFFRAYDAERPLEPVERALLRRRAIAGAVRFTVTRLTDYHLREAVGERVVKDFRRFVARLDALEGMSDEGFVEWIGLGPRR